MNQINTEPYNKQNDLNNLESYNYVLPEHLIASVPREKRDEANLLVFNAGGFESLKDVADSNNAKNADSNVEHTKFSNILHYLKKGDCLVLNNSKVIPALLFGYKSDTGAKIEVVLHKKLGGVNGSEIGGTSGSKLNGLNGNIDTLWEVLAKPAKKLKVGETVVFDSNLSAIVVCKCEKSGNVSLSFKHSGNFENALDKVGNMPLPPYIQKKLSRAELEARQDFYKQRYQTVYAEKGASVAAPTAGLHFTKDLLAKIQQAGISICFVTLNVGLGTFQPVKEQDITKHQMHTEYYEISKASAEIINKSKRDGGRVVAVGTTSMRTLECAAYLAGGLAQVKAQSKDTGIFITPGFEFKIVDALITNFHLPKSTLLMLVSAFVGHDNMHNIYKEAISKEYRFFSFGDSSLLVR
ncbi:MAG: tRNA preQ1(34) S-adenosylmethionine ribosyltransferase-isomerase QueA [Firmicutes bacterium]|nr:tRNA preQ1(34) S-adenosylmethionine ribosyltransferase-isomerase QueA [Bacillota bacterium]